EAGAAGDRRDEGKRERALAAHTCGRGRRDRGASLRGRGHDRHGQDREASPIAFFIDSSLKLVRLGVSADRRVSTLLGAVSMIKWPQGGSASTHPAVSRNCRKRIALSPSRVQIWTNGTSRCLCDPFAIPR